MRFLRKDIGDKIYFFIIIVLLFSIIYQTSYFIVHAKDSSPEVATSTKATKVEQKGIEEQPVSSNPSNSEEVLSATDNVEKTPEQKIVKKDKTSSKTDLLLYVLQQGIPYNNKTTDYGLENVIEYLTKVNIHDPKTLISSQLPFVDSYEVDDLEITEEEEKEIYNLTNSKPLNTDQVEVNHNDGNPSVLLYCTHTTESYMSSQVKIDYSSYARSRNENYNMLAVSNEIKKVMEDKYGLNVILDTTVHDYPSYNTSYSNSLKTIRKNLEQYPSIKYVFDIHRDGLPDNQKNKEKYATVVNEVNSAKIMTVVGMNHENSAKNSAFADKVYNSLNSMYPSLAQPTIKRKTAKYNQFVSDNALLFEIGSNLSTLEEAKASGAFLGDALGKVIKEN